MKHQAVDYTNNPQFWERLRIFISDVQVNDQMSQEERDMILANCDYKLNNFTNEELVSKEKMFAFAEWCYEGEYTYMDTNWVTENGDLFTTAQLFEIFKNKDK